MREGYAELAVDKAAIRETISGDPKVQALSAATFDLVAEWWANNRAHFTGITATTRPANLISEISESLLSRFRPRPLIDEYGVYEQLMSYWNEVMHDDVALIMADGWDGAAKPRKTIEDKDRRLTETPDLVIGNGRNATKVKTDLIPPSLIVTRYFAEERARLDDLEARAEASSQAVEEFIEENSGDDGLLASAMDEEKITRALAIARLRNARKEPDTAGEVAALTCLIARYDAEASAKAAVKSATAELDRKTLERYSTLTRADIELLVIDDKWGATITRGVEAELQALIQQLVTRLRELAERYESTLGARECEVDTLSAKVASHLAAMGVAYE